MPCSRSQEAPLLQVPFLRYCAHRSPSCCSEALLTGRLPCSDAGAQVGAEARILQLQSVLNVLTHHPILTSGSAGVTAFLPAALERSLLADYQNLMSLVKSMHVAVEETNWHALLQWCNTDIADDI